jgi:apolipoprotein N-acyltransferase
VGPRTADRILSRAWVAVALTLISAALCAAAFPPLRLRALAWVALVPLLVALRRGTVVRRLCLGMLWALAIGFGIGTWMPGAVSQYFHQPLVIGVGLFLFVAGAMAGPYYMAFAALYAPLTARAGIAAPLLAGAAWAAVELLRGRLLNGTLLDLGNSPWGTFGYSQAGNLPLLQVASVTGVYGVSFVLVCVNAALAAALDALACAHGLGRKEWMGLALVLGIAACVLVSGALTLRSGERGHHRVVPIAIAQADLGAAVRWSSEGPARTLDAYLRLTRDAFARGRPEIVFWPEAALPFFLEQDAPARRSIADALREHDAELVIGSLRAAGADGAAPYTNSVYLFDADGVIAARYDKQYLLPFMEYFPLRLELVRRRFGRVGELTPGETTSLLPTRAGPAGIVVCNEALLPHVAAQRMAAGAVYLVNPSNDSWVSDAGFAWQQFDIAALRAIEQRTYVVRVSDSGPSGVIDPLGRVVARTEPLTRDVVLASVTPSAGTSLYARVGDLFGVVCLCVVAVTLLRRDRGPTV